MMLAVILFLCGVTTISSVPIESTTETPVCERIQKSAKRLKLIETEFGCCEGPDCQQVENQDCKRALQEELQPCFLNSDGTCFTDALLKEPRIIRDTCGDISNVCQALRDSRYALYDTMDMMCPLLDPEARFFFAEAGCAVGCVAASPLCGVAALFTAGLSIPICFAGCGTCLAGALAIPI